MAVQLNGTFKAGKPCLEPPRLAGRLKWRGGRTAVQGNPGRGVLVVAAAALAVLQYQRPALCALAVAMVWSLLESFLKKWKKEYREQKFLRCLRRGRIEEALAINPHIQPRSALWWKRLAVLFAHERWQEAADAAAQLEDGEERDLLRAMICLGAKQPQQALDLCPPLPAGMWRMVRAQAHFQRGEWQQVLAALRGTARDRQIPAVECAWLKGMSYFHLGQYKPAANLLRQAAEKGGAEYDQARIWLEEALARLD